MESYEKTERLWKVVKGLMDDRRNAGQMKKSNPFSLSFGKEPVSYISRDYQSNEILDSFESDTPSYQVCMITGVKGAGKTVAMSAIANTLAADSRWIIVNLNPERDLLRTLTAELSNRKDLFEMFRDAKINLSYLGFGLEIDGEPPITDMVVALRRMLEKLTKSGRRILITIDEVSLNRQIREFASQFQIFMRENLNVFLIMTGLYENIYELQNEKTLTFLFRAAKVELKPLSIPLIMQKYREVFEMSEDEALEMAKATMGYPFAFQVLGYLLWREGGKKSLENLLPQYDTYLEDYVYEKIWSELSRKDKEVVAAMCDAPSTKVETIRNRLKMSSNSFSTYRKRLTKKGIIQSPDYGWLSFTLPRFREFILRQEIL